MKKFIFLFVVIFLLIITVIFYKSSERNRQVKIVSPKPVNTSPHPDEETITLISTGDIGLVRDVNYRIQQKKDVNYPFLKIAEYLKNADLTVINLEGPVINNCPIIITGFKFCGNAQNANGLSFAGIDAANLANNHTTNYGLEGLRETVSALESVGIKPFGTDDQIQYIKLKNKIFALVGFVELGNNWAGLNNATAENVGKIVSNASKNSDVVIVSFHWGVEYTRNPTENQIALAHKAIDSGADIILGNHPHWIQTNEIYKEKFITYAQGNTIFDQDWSQETKEGVIYKFVYRDGNFEKIEEKYTIIEDNAQPRFATDTETARIISCLTKICKR